jgi:hypothetical protein
MSLRVANPSSEIFCMSIHSSVSLDTCVCSSSHVRLLATLRSGVTRVMTAGGCSWTGADGPILALLPIAARLIPR